MATITHSVDRVGAASERGENRGNDDDRQRRELHRAEGANAGALA